MSGIPRQRLQSEKLHYGRPQDTTYVEAGRAESLLLSYGHYRLKSGAWSGGGPFYQVTDEIKHSGERTFPGYMRIIWREPTTAVGVNGVSTRFVQNVPSAKQYASNWSSHESTNFSYAAKGYHATRPGNPTASVGQFLVELRDLPKIPLVQGDRSYVSLFKRGFSFTQICREARSIARQALDLSRGLPVGSEFLNYVFGWKPFVEDLRQIYRTWNSVDKQMAQIIRQNGKSQRRKCSLGNNTEIIESVKQTFPNPGVNVFGFPGDYAWGGGNTIYSKTTTRKTKVWYAAAYRYYIPDVSSSQWQTRAKLALFGALPTPELVWELVPFSWLIDWSINVGDVVSNMSMNAVDNLVQLYSYIMREVTIETVATAECQWKGQNNCYAAGTATFKSEKTQITKTRSGGGSPYALSAVSGTPLSGYQAGVLAALGLNLAK